METDTSLPNKVIEIAHKQGAKVTDPIARTNLSLPGARHDPLTPLNQPWLPIDTSKFVPDPTPSEKVVQELSTTERLEDPETGQRFGVIRANWEKFNPKSSVADQTPVNVFFSLYLNENNKERRSGVKDEVHLRFEQLAHTLPEYPLLGIDFPSVGESDPLRPDQTSTLPEDSYFAIADAQLRMMAKLGIKRINVGGQSMGAYAALAVAVRAAEHGIKVDHILLCETPGVVKMSVLELMKKDLTEFGTLDLHHSHPFDPLLYKAAGLDRDPSLWERSTSLLKILPQLFSKDPTFVYAEAMADATVKDRIGQVFESQDELNKKLNIAASPTTVAFINGTESTVSPAKDVLAIVKDYSDQQSKPRVTSTFYPGVGHFGLVNPKVYAAEVALQLTGSAFSAGLNHTT